MYQNYKLERIMRGKEIGTRTIDADLSQRTFDSLEREGITSLRGLEGKTVAELLKIRNLGMRGVAELKVECEMRGINTAIDYPENDERLERLRCKARRKRADKFCVEEVRIDEVTMSSRTQSSLMRAGVETLNELGEMTVDELLRIRNLGMKGVKELKRICREHDIKTAVDM